jgi:hypothetical protein
MRRKVRRETLIGLAEKLPPCVVGMEACCGAHHLGRVFADHGHEVRLMSPEYVRPYVKAQKNDDRDAEGIAEAATRPTMRFVELKSQDQLPARSAASPRRSNATHAASAVEPVIGHAKGEHRRGRNFLKRGTATPPAPCSPPLATTSGGSRSGSPPFSAPSSRRCSQMRSTLPSPGSAKSELQIVAPPQPMRTTSWPTRYGCGAGTARSRSPAAFGTRPIDQRFVSRATKCNRRSNSHEAGSG